jgi:hypothetical protein
MDGWVYVNGMRPESQKITFLEKKTIMRTLSSIGGLEQINQENGWAWSIFIETEKGF